MLHISPFSGHLSLSLSFSLSPLPPPFLSLSLSLLYISPVPVSKYLFLCLLKSWQWYSRNNNGWTHPVVRNLMRGALLSYFYWQRRSRHSLHPWMEDQTLLFHHLHLKNERLKGIERINREKERERERERDGQIAWVGSIRGRGNLRLRKWRYHADLVSLIWSPQLLNLQAAWHKMVQPVP